VINSPSGVPVAVHEPPGDHPADLRSNLIRHLQRSNAPVWTGRHESVGSHRSSGLASDGCYADDLWNRSWPWWGWALRWHSPGTSKTRY